VEILGKLVNKKTQLNLEEALKPPIMEKEIPTALKQGACKMYPEGELMRNEFWEYSEVLCAIDHNRILCGVGLRCSGSQKTGIRPVMCIQKAVSSKTVRDFRPVTLPNTD
jgi:hypothetical protein